jgi:hypothetical protein
MGKESVSKSMTAFLSQFLATKTHTLTLEQFLALLPFNLQMFMFEHPEELTPF